MNREKIKSLANKLVILILGALVVGGIAHATFGGEAPVEIAECNNCVFNVSVGSEASSEGLVGAGSPNRLPHGYWDTSDGYYVDGVSVIDGSGNVSAALKLSAVSTTPFGQLGIGAGGNTTSTISTGRFCMYAGQENGTSVYVYMPLGAEAGEPFATTTQSCF